MLTVDVPNKLKARFNKWDNLQIALPSVVSFMGDLLKLHCFLKTGGISSFQYQRFSKSALLCFNCHTP